MRILLTGCTGFVGSLLAPRMALAGHELFCLCRSDKSAALGEKVVWDGSFAIDPARFPASVEVVIHLAQSRSYRDFPTDSQEMFSVNVAMTMALLNWAARSGIRHFCLISSGAVYEPFRAAPLKEDAVLAPTGFLGASKLASEVIARPFSSIFALNILRLFSPYGPGQRDRLIPELIWRIRSGTPVQITSNGEGIRLAPTFVDDIIEVILASMASSWTETLNVAAPEALSIRQISNIIGRQLGIEPKFEVVNKPAPDVIPDLSRLASRYELSRFTRFEDGLRKTISGAICTGSS